MISRRCILQYRALAQDFLTLLRVPERSRLRQSKPTPRLKRTAYVEQGLSSEVTSPRDEQKTTDIIPGTSILL